MFPRRPERLKTFDYQGLHRYHLRFCTYQRRRIFVAPAAVEIVLREIRRAARSEQFAILAYYPFLGSDVYGMAELLEIFSNSWSG